MALAVDASRSLAVGRASAPSSRNVRKASSMSRPTEEEIEADLAHRKVVALESIAASLERLTGALGADDSVIDVRVQKHGDAGADGVV